MDFNKDLGIETVTQKVQNIEDIIPSQFSDKVGHIEWFSLVNECVKS